MSMTIQQFVYKWQASTRTERSASQEHFLDLCEALGQPKPGDIDPKGKFFTFEAGLTKTSGGFGFADVWYKGHFAWEYKGPHKDLNVAFNQLLQYTQALQNPPLLVVSDMKRFIVSTRVTNYPTKTYDFTLEDLIDNKPTLRCDKPPVEVLRALFGNANYLLPEITIETVTKAAADRFGDLAQMLTTSNSARTGYDPYLVARYLMRVLFCLFAEDINLLPNQLFTGLLKRFANNITLANHQTQELFQRMSQANSVFGIEVIPYVNGGLFTNEQIPIVLNEKELAILVQACEFDWSSIEPSIFGELFVRSIDPAKRSQRGSHYTSVKDIADVVEPVVMVPLRREWDEVRKQAEAQVAQRNATTGSTSNKAALKAGQTITDFLSRLANVLVLDPACGSGNFLYVALKRLLDLEKEVRLFAIMHDIQLMLQRIGVAPNQLFGIEVDEYAHELASIVVWIGYIQWLHDNGYPIPTNPVLENISENITLGDAILAYNDNGEPIEPQWPEADYIVGNPPFLGTKKLRSQLNDKYVEDLWQVYKARIPPFSDLVCYWFEKARVEILTNRAVRAGLLATQGIRGGLNRKVLENIKKTGDIFMAYSDRDWVLEGANVHVSIIGFDNGEEQKRTLNGESVSFINSDLTSAANLTQAEVLRENANLSFIADVQAGPFDIDASTARQMLEDNSNSNGRPNSDVVRPSLNAIDITRRPRNMWVIDFGVNMSLEQASEYKQPYAYVYTYVKPVRDNTRETRTSNNWWLHARPGPSFRRAISKLKRFIVTPALAKHKVFVWVESPALPDHALVVFAREDDYFLGVLQSKIHILWSLRKGTALEDRPRYTPTTSFETFPFPYPPGTERQNHPQVQAIAAVAKGLVEFRDAWLNEPGLSEAELKNRTLTNLYNGPDEKPVETEELRKVRYTLKDWHRMLDEAVLAAYGWPLHISDDDILARLLALNLARAAK